MTERVIDATNPAGELNFSVFAALAQFERGLIRERTQAGLDTVREKGRNVVAHLFRKVKLAQEVTEKEMKIKDICPALGISRSPYSSYLELYESIRKSWDLSQLLGHLAL